ncbi:MAG: hypothetical protein HYT39_02660 [Candidatus Sungbacteria bacterium]|nr:hypothetical protein [Candidatus Sungbacteria bacterium]
MKTTRHVFLVALRVPARAPAAVPVSRAIFIGKDLDPTQVEEAARTMVKRQKLADPPFVGTPRILILTTTVTQTEEETSETHEWVEVPFTL